MVTVVAQKLYKYVVISKRMSYNKFNHSKSKIMKKSCDQKNYKIRCS